jgi:SAM-dependent methyltransferase
MNRERPDGGAPGPGAASSPAGLYFSQAAVWDRFDERERKRIEETVAAVPRGVATALDVGCGDGRLLGPLASVVPVVVGVDRWSVPLLRAPGSKTLGCITALPFRGASFDLVMAAEVIEHLAPQDFHAASAELARVSRRYVLVTVPYRENLLENTCWCSRCRSRFHAWGHLRSYGSADVLGRPDLLQLELLRPIVVEEIEVMPRVSLWLLRRVARRYAFSQTARCPQCGGGAQAGTGNLLAFFLQRLLWRLSARQPRQHRGRWLLALYRKR